MTFLAVTAMERFGFRQPAGVKNTGADGLQFHICPA